MPKLIFRLFFSFVLFVSVFVVPEYKVSNCDNNTLPSVPPSDTNSLSPTASVALSKLFAVMYSYLKMLK